HLRLSDGGGRLHAHQVLWLQTGPGPPGPDVFQMKSLAGDQGQSQAGAQDLPAAFAEGTVEFKKSLAHVSRRAYPGPKFTRIPGKFRGSRTHLSPLAPVPRSACVPATAGSE